MLKSWFARLKALFDPAGVKKYITQVSLILVSLLIATRADKCREANKDREKLLEYLTAIRTDLQEETETDEMNLRDCRRDMECLVNFFIKSGKPHNDSLYAAYSSFASVYQRGVFRAFAPSTFDMMMQTGDASLLKDIALRSRLASVFAFRKNVIQKDLEEFDRQTQECAEKLGRFFDLTLMASGEAEAFLLDKTGFMRDPHNEVFLLLRTAGLRGFHLEKAIEELKDTQMSLDNYIKTL